jgi:vancomycin resistance protein YoaR
MVERGAPAEGETPPRQFAPVEVTEPANTGDSTGNGAASATGPRQVPDQAAEPDGPAPTGPEQESSGAADATCPVPPAARPSPRPRPAPIETGELPTGPAAAEPTSSWFEPGDTESTQLLPHVPDDGEQATELLAVPPQAPTPGRRRRRRGLLVLAAVVVVLALLYVGDLVLGAGSVPRGVTVGGVPVGGLELAAAEQRLRSEIEPRATRPVQVTVGEVRSEIDPQAAGLEVDWRATMDRAREQPLNPVTRITSFFTTREVGVAATADDQALAAALEQLAPVVDRAPVEGGVRFEGVTPVPVDPVPGQRLDIPAATTVLTREWATGRPVALPLTELAPTTAPDDVAAVIEGVARPAVSAPVTIRGEDVQATLPPQAIAEALSFRAEGGKLVPEINQQVIVDAVDPALAPSETPGRDATIDFSSGAPVVVPSQDGRGVDYDTTLADLLTVLTGTGPREIVAVYADQPAEVTTEELNAQGITGLISEFTTSGFARDSGINIKRAAQQIDGTIVGPGETFSLNGATSPRNAANGYIEAGIINEGNPSRGVGGGVSQVATTLYNAAYFAGMVDVTHKPHSFYISRYPPGREATVFEGAIDLKFRNDGPTGVLIKTAWTPSSITVRMYGTKRYEVSSTTGERTNPVPPHPVTIPAGEPCVPSQGAPGFTITDTRTLRDIHTGETRSETQTTRYNASPIVTCEE